MVCLIYKDLCSLSTLLCFISGSMGNVKEKSYGEVLTCRKKYTVRGLVECVDMLNLRDLRKWGV
jgi:hypothetical protein